MPIITGWGLDVSRRLYDGKVNGYIALSMPFAKDVVLLV